MTLSVDHWFLHRRSAGVRELGTRNLTCGRTATILSPPDGTPLQRSFEELSQQLARLPRLFFEADGSFLWRFSEGQLEGQLYEGTAGCTHIELRGNPGQAAWRQFVGCVGWPDQTLMVQLAREGVFIPEPEFADWLSH